jgi:ketosteroid isomerase-like protein
MDSALARPPHLQRLVQFFESISLQDAGRMTQVYTDDAWFKDPFNEVRGVSNIARIFTHMFEQVDSPRFVVRETVSQGESAFITWDFEFGFRPPLRGTPQRIHGCSHVRFAADGRVEYHRDYWDAAEELYEKLPVLGAFMRWLRRRAALPAA